MEEYEHEKELKEEIMEQGRHLFIYGYKNEQRSDFLKGLESGYPIIADSDKPAALYFDSLGIPEMNIDLKGKDTLLIHVSSREYLSFAVAARILERSMGLNITDLDIRFSTLISLIKIDKNMDYAEIKTVEDLLKEIKTSRDFYYESYINYVKGLIASISIDDIAIPFLELDMFVRLYKEAMNMKSYFGIIFDKQTPLMPSSTQAINNLIGSRINGDISVKVAIEPDDWETYRDSNGQLVQAIHDYGTVELDDSYKKYMKRRKTNM